MRILYRDLETAKSIAKRLGRETKARLSQCQEVLAAASGYSDWHELHHVRNTEGSPIETLDLGQLANFEARLSKGLNANVGDVQHALSCSPAIPRARFGLAEHVSLRAAAFRLTEIPDPGRRKPGAVGKFKSDGKPLILRHFGRPVSCITDRSANVAVADFEFVTPRTPLPLFIPARLYLAYGIWTEPDGSKVLFSRDYMPLWRLKDDERPERLSPVEWINYTEQRWFWTDANAPWDNVQRMREHVRRLEDFGVKGVPKLVEVLPTLVFGNQNGSFGSTARSYFADRADSATNVEDLLETLTD
jgi:hypothetical protein